MSTTSTPFKGALKAKRKTDLSEIASALGISVHQAKRDELEEDIKKHLVANRSKLGSDERFEGLYNSLDRGERKAGKAYEGSSDSDAGSPHFPRTPIKHTQNLINRVNGAASDVAADASALTSAVKSRAQKATDTVSTTLRSAQEESQHALKEANSLITTATKKGKAIGKYAKKKALNLYHSSRESLSDSSNLIRILIAAEALMLVYTVYPTRVYTFGETKTEHLLKHASFDGFNTSRWSLVLPDPAGFLSISKFWQPILLWQLWTVALPSLAAHLITFQKRHDPSPVTFTYVRLALLLFLTSPSLISGGGNLPSSFGVAAGVPVAQKLGVIGTLRANASYGLVPLDGSLQVLVTGLVAALATYEAVATRGR